MGWSQGFFLRMWAPVVHEKHLCHSASGSVACWGLLKSNLDLNLGMFFIVGWEPAKLIRWNQPCTGVAVIVSHLLYFSVASPRLFGSWNLPMDMLEETFGWDQTFLEKILMLSSCSPRPVGSWDELLPLQVPSLPGLGATIFTQIISASLKENCNLVL